MGDDDRLYFIRNMEVFEEKGEDLEYWVTEYEVEVDSFFGSLCEYGPYQLVQWDTSIDAKGRKRSLCLIVKEAVFPDGSKGFKTAHKKGFYHGGGITQELIALASLYFRKRLKLLGMVRQNDKPLRIKLPKQRIDEALISGESHLFKLREWLEKIRKLEPTYHQSYMFAVNLYCQALNIIEDRPDVAYLNLISTIETLCQDTDVGEVKLSDVDSELAKMVGEIKDEDLRNRLEKAICEKEGLIRRKFVKFILDHVEGNFWGVSNSYKDGDVRPDELEDLLNKIYKQRSRTLHNGEPFPPYIFSSPQFGADIPMGEWTVVGERKWFKEDYIPNPHFFERLVNHVLKVFVERHQVK
ncbi:hypothetical protein CEE36_02485 [candidate division TA06 bacterium B3_TA06]|uniref:Apea-like HEPN domain-containing protein n=1 Tax=candidate division TA06 bacterium B3_TA06 TaxID=2012487 RepID=A0A532VAK8_UNCT6|nr:MAG: hypothetical protein CEE36_02485 [candidate division TA06 bacterium B3_TA06]